MRANLVGRSLVSAITHTPASGPFDPVTTPPMAVEPTVPVACCALAGIAATRPNNSSIQSLNVMEVLPHMKAFGQAERLAQAYAEAVGKKRVETAWRRCPRRRRKDGIAAQRRRCQPAGVAGPGSAGMVVAGGEVVARNGRSSMAAKGGRDKARTTAAATNTQRNTSAKSIPRLAAKAPSEAAPRSGTAPSQARMIAPMTATTSALPSERKKFMAPMATPT